MGLRERFFWDFEETLWVETKWGVGERERVDGGIRELFRAMLGERLEGETDRRSISLLAPGVGDRDLERFKVFRGGPR